MRHARILALSLLLSFSPAVLAREGSSNVSSARETLEFMGKMLALNTMLRADFDGVGRMNVVGDELAELNQLACQPVILTGYDRGNSYYTNGPLISNDLYHQAWYFPNGRLFVAQLGLDTTIYSPNGRVMAYHRMHGN